MKYIWNTVLPAVTAAVVLLSSGCEKKVAPPMDNIHTRDQKVKEILRLTDSRQYRAALPIVEKYQLLEPANEFLDELKQLICTNIAIQEAEAFAQKGQLQEACKHLDNCILEYGELPGIMNAKKVYLDLLEMGKRIEALKEPASSAQMRENARWLTNYAAKYKNVKLRKFADEKIRESVEVSKLEVDRAGFLIYADAMDQLKQGNFSRTLALTALLAAEQQYQFHARHIRNGGLYDVPYLKEMQKKQREDIRPDLKQKAK